MNDRTDSNANIAPKPPSPMNDVIPEFWPPADPIEPVRIRRFPWILAPLVAIPALALPRRFGPHLAGAGWKAALFVHLLAVILVIGSVIACNTRHPQGPENITLLEAPLFRPIDGIREALAGFIVLFYYTWQSWTEIIATFVVAAGIEAGLWFGALLLVPLHTAGEGARRAYLRSVKLVLWSTAAQVPIVWIFLYVLAPLLNHLSNDEVWFFFLLVLLEFWWITVLYRLGGRYGGPPEGPRWRPRNPRCEKCGYSLVGLTRAGRCPECNTPVADSLPERRQPPAFARARGFMTRTYAFFATITAVLFKKAFTRGITTWSDHRAARYFAVIVCEIIGVIVAVTVAGILYIDGQFKSLDTLFDHDLTVTLYSVSRFLSPFISTLISGPIGGVAAGVLILINGLFLNRFGFRDCADRVVVLFYGSAWLLTSVCVGTLGGWTAYGIIESGKPWPSIHLIDKYRVEVDHLIWTLGFVPAAVVLCLGLLQQRRLLKQIRYANA